MRKGYTVKRQEEIIGVGFITKTLARDGRFYLATNEAQVCETLRQARRMYHGNIFNRVGAKGTDFTYIEGPRGGVHRIGSRHD